MLQLTGKDDKILAVKSPLKAYKTSKNATQGKRSDKKARGVYFKVHGILWV